MKLSSYPKISIEYIAGLFDGEGCVGIYRNKGSYDIRYKNLKKSSSFVRIVNIAATYKPVLIQIQNTLGYGRLRNLKTKKKRNKQNWEWVIGSKENIIDFLTKIYPYSHEKREQIDLMIKTMRGELDELESALRLKALKKVSYEN